jgi:hypothetical protein
MNYTRCEAVSCHHSSARAVQAPWLTRRILRCHNVPYCSLYGLPSRLHKEVARAVDESLSPPELNSNTMSTSLDALERIQFLSALSPNRGERAWVQDILEGWEDGSVDEYTRLTPFLRRPSTPVSAYGLVSSTEGEYGEKSYIDLHK